MSIQLRITPPGGQARLVTLPDGASIEVRPGDRVEVVAKDGMVAKAIVRGNDVIVETPSGETIHLKNFALTMQTDQPAELVLPEPQQISLRVTDDAGHQQFRTLQPGERFVPAPNQHVEVLGANLPSRFEPHGRDVSFTTASGERFTIANVVGTDGTPQPDRISFPDLYQFGGLANGDSKGLGLQPLSLVPLDFDAPSFAATQGVDATKVTTLAEISGPHGVVGSSEPPLGHAGDDGGDGDGPSAPGAPAPTLQVPGAVNPTGSPLFTPIQLTAGEVHEPRAGTLPPATPPAVTPPTVVVPATPATLPTQPEQPTQPTGEDPLPGEDGAIEEILGPDAPVITGLTSDTDTGASDADGLTGLSRPTVAGTATPGLTVIVRVDGVDVGSAIADSHGAWHFTFTSPLADGHHAVTAIAVSATGLPSPSSAGLAIGIDTTAPGAAVISGLTAGTDTGRSQTDGLTSDAQPTIVGTAEAGARVAVYDGTTLLGTVTANAAGHWELPLSSPLADGPHTLTARATDDFGNAGPDSVPRDITIDTAAPDSTLTGLTAATDTGVSDSDSLTKTATPTLVGTADPLATVTIMEGATVLGTAVADLTGHWRLPLTAPLTHGTHDITVYASDAAGNVAGTGGSGTVEIDLVAPLAPVVSGLGSGSDTGTNPSDGLTRQDQPVVIGTAEANTSVDVYDGATLLGTVVADGGGHWSLAVPSSMLDGEHALSAIATDRAGNTGPSSVAKDVTVVTSTPTPTINPLVTGPNPPLTGTAGPHTTVILVLDGGDPITLTADDDGNWTYTPPTPLTDGHHTVSVTSTDDAGNTGTAGPADVLVVIAYPPAPTLTDITPATDTGLSDTDGITANAHPMIRGTGEPGTTITVFSDGVPIGTATPDGTGHWTLTPTGAIPDGPHDLTAVARDTFNHDSGNSNRLPITIDTTAPGAPVVTGLTVATDTGASHTDAVTSQTKPVLKGTAEAGATVDIYDGTTHLGTVKADLNGNWLLPVSQTLTQGTHGVTAVATDTAGNQSATSATKNVTIDTGAPGKPVVTGLTTDTDSAGLSHSDNLTNVSSPTIIGTAEANATVEVYDGATLLGTVTADGTGAWSLPVVTTLVDGTHGITAVAVDTAGNRSATSTSKAVTIDATAPAAPAVTGLTIATDTGVSHTDSVTKVTRPVIVGTAEANSTVNVYDGTTLIGTVKADTQGGWTLKPAVALTDGTHHVTATSSDAAGNVSAPSGEHLVTITTSAPSVPVVTGLTVDTDTGASHTDAITSDATPTITGTAAPHGQVDVYDGSTLLGSVDADATGAWSLPVGTPLTPGVHAIHAVVTDAIGNTSGPSADKNIEIDTGAPATPAFTSITTDTNVGTDFVTSDNTLVISGTAENNSAISVSIAGQTLTTTTNGSGVWTTSASATIADGTYTATVTSTDLAGNSSTATQSITVDTGNPSSGLAITGISTDTNVSPDFVTSDNTLVISGTAEIGTTNSVTVAGQTLAATTDASGNWTATVSTAIADGTYTATVTSKDLAGNTSTATQSVTVDTGNPSTGLAITAISTDSNVTTDFVTNDNTLVFSGTAEIGTTNSVSVAGQTLAATTDASGNWTATVSSAIADGTYTATVTSKDLAGNTSTATQSITVDTGNPSSGLAITAISTDSGTDGDYNTSDNTLVISGTAEIGSTNSVSIAGQTLAATTDASGNWTAAVSATIADGTYTAIVTSKDLAGNTSTASQSITVDTGNPSSGLAITGISTDTNVSTDFVTSDDTLILSGTAEVGSTNSVTIAGQTLAATTDASGNWTATVSATIADGTYTATVTSTDLAGNSSTATQSVTVDTSNPSSGLAITAISADTNITTDFVTNDNTLIVSGTAEIGTTNSVEIAGQTLAATTDASGNWTAAVSSAIADGTYTATVTSTDLAGNTSTATQSVTVDTGNPSTGLAITAISTDTNVSTDFVTSDNTLVIAGTAEIGTTNSVSIAGQTLAATTDASGNWTATVSTAIADGTYTATVTSTDLAGSTSTATQSITVDTGAPSTGLAFTSITTDSNVTTDYVTNDNTLVLSGTAEIGTTNSVTIAGQTLSATTDASGNWSTVLSSAIADGTYTATVTSKDLAGNTSTATQSITVDTGNPSSGLAITAISTDTNVSTDFVTGDNTLVISGTAEIGTTNSVSVAGQTLAATTDASGNWTATVSTAIADGTYTATVTSKDLAGNTSTATQSITVDTGNPSTGLAITAISTDTNVSTDFVTSDNTLVISGTAEIGTSNSITIAGQTLAATTDASGNWTATVSTAIADGTYTATVTSTDLAGNTSTATQSVTVDTGNPSSGLAITAISSDTNVTTDFVTSDNTLVISGTAEIGTTNSVTVAGQTLAATTDASGNWTATVSTAIADGTYTATVTSKDLAGNTSTATQSITVDTGNPATGLAITGISTDTNVSTDYVTSDNTLVISGTAEIGTSNSVTIAGQTLTATTDASGNWTSVVSTAIADGTYTATVTSKDLAGNTSTATQSVTVDTGNPSTGLAITAVSTDTNVATDFVTSDNTLVISGTAEIGSTNSVSVAGQTLSATTDASGNWTATVSTAIADGTYTATVTSKDLAGNTSTATQSITVDTGNPSTGLAITAISTDSGTAGDYNTNDNTLVISGTAEIGTTNSVSIAGQTLTATTDASGNWTSVVSTAITDGTYTATVTSKDLAGNTSTATQSVTVNTATLTAPAITAISTDSNITTDYVTNDNTIVISGTAAVGTTNSVSIAGQTLAATTDGSGNWTATVSTAITDGTYTATVTSTDGLGNTNTGTQSITIDTSNPSTGLAITAISTDSNVTTDFVTSDNTLVISGTAEIGTTNSVSVAGQTLAATTDASGNWTAAVSTAITDGTYTATVTSKDLAGNTSTATQSITVDTGNPSTGLAITAITTDTGTAGDFNTSDNTLVISGTAEIGSTNSVDIAGQTLAATTDASGNWTAAVSTAIADGTYTATVTSKDLAGNTSTATQSVTISAGTLAAPAITAISTDSNVTTDYVTSDNTIVISGTAAVGTTNSVSIAGQTLAATTDGSGNWTATVSTAITDGTYTATVTSTDGLGNTNTGTQSITIDTSNPSTGLAISAISADTGTAGDFITTDDTLVISGTAEIGTTNSVDIAGQTLAATTDASGNWTTSASTAIAAGTYTATVTSTDLAGNTSTATQSVTVSASGSVAITGLTAATDTGVSDSDAITYNTAPTLTGTAPAGEGVEIFEGTTSLGTATTDGTGHWSVDLAGPLAEGSHSLFARISPAGGTVDSSTATVQILTTATPLTPPTVTGLTSGTDTWLFSSFNADNITRLDSPSLTGVGPLGGTVLVYAGGTLLGTAVADATTGVWTLPVSPSLPDGTYVISARTTDVAGNLSAPSTVPATIVIDATAPGAPVVLGISQVIAEDSGRSQTDGTTNANTPLIYGTAEPGARVLIYDGNTLITASAITADADGNWSVRADAQMTSGSHDIRATASDVAGNESDLSAPVTVEIDRVAPAVPVVSGLTALTDSGSSSTDGITSNTLPTLTGTAEAGALVEVFDGGSVTAGVLTGGTLLGTVKADSSTNWTLPLSTPLTEATHTINARATDLAGNLGPATAAGTSFTVDTTAPAVPVVSGLSDATDTGTFNTDDISKNNLPTIEGTGVNGTTVTVYDGNTLLGTATVSGGAWTLVPGENLQDGTHSLAATATDAAGNESALSAIKDVVIKTSTDVPTVSGLVASGATTTVYGTAAAGVSVSVSIDGGATATVTANAKGNWSYTPGVALTAGAHTITAIATDVAGNTATSGSLPLAVAGVPQAPIVTGLTSATDTGTYNTDDITKLTNPSVTGTGKASTDVKVFVDAVSVGTVTADGSGNWTLPLTAALAEGTHAVTAVSVTAGGAVSGLSAERAVVVDLTAPDAPEVQGLELASDTGVSNADGITKTASPVIAGGAEAGSIIKIYDGATLIGTTAADADGGWRFTLTGLTEASHSLTVTATDVAGNTSVASTSFPLVIDQTAPLSTTIAVTGLTTATDTGSSNTDAVTKLNTPILAGTAENDAQVSVYEGTMLVGTTQADSSGNWTLPITETLADGTHTFTATSTDTAGNTSALSTGKDVLIDTLAPAAPLISGLQAPTDTGTSATDNLTKNTTPTLQGTAEALSTVNIYDGAELIGTATAAGDGSWTFPVPAGTPLDDGLHPFTATATDKAGNEGAASAIKTVNVVSSMAAPTVVLVASGPSAPVHGTAVPESFVTITLDGGTPVVVQTDSSGNWSYVPPSPLSLGSHTVSVTSADKAGNSASAGPATVTVSAGPAAPVVTGLTTPTDSGANNHDGITKYPTPTVYGTTKAGTTVTVYVDGVAQVPTATVVGTGWSLVLPTALANGSHTITAIAKDAALNASGTSNAKTVVIDSVAPTTPIVHGLTPGPGNTAVNTHDQHPMVTGKAEANALVTLYEGSTSTVLGTAYADSHGNWKIQPVLAQAPGSHDWRATATDLAGNVSARSGIKTSHIETAAGQTFSPNTVALDASSKTGTSSTATNDDTPKLAITALPGATVNVYIDGKKNGAADVADATTGLATHQVVGSLSPGTHKVTIIQTSLEGNQGPSSAVANVTYKHNKLHHPVAIHVTPATDTGTSDHDRVTSNDTPTIYGKTQEPGAFVEIFEGATSLGKVATHATAHDGNWSFAIPAGAPLAAGVHNLTFKTEDDAGNISKATGHVKVTIVASGLAAPTGLGFAAPTDTGTSATDHITTSTNPIVVGNTPTAGSKVQVYVDGTPDGNPETAQFNGNVMHQIVTPLVGAAATGGAGDHVITLRATDAVGNLSTSATMNVSVLTSTAVPTITSALTGASPSLTGTASAGSTVSLVIDGGAAVTVTANGSGAWSYPTSFTLGSSHTVLATASDAAGNTAVSGGSATTVTVTAAATIGITSGTDTENAVAIDPTGLDDGALKTFISTPTLTGTAPAYPNTTIKVLISGDTTHLVTTDGTGAWTMTPTSSLSVGTHTISSTTTADVAIASASLVIATGAPTLAMTDMVSASFVSTIFFPRADTTPSVNISDGDTGTLNTFKVIAATSNHGVWRLATNAAVSHLTAAVVPGTDTFLEKNISTSKQFLGYDPQTDGAGNPGSVGFDSITLQLVVTSGPATGAYAQGTLYVFNGVADTNPYMVFENPANHIDATGISLVYDEPSLDLGKLGTLQETALPALATTRPAETGWQAELHALLAPTAPVAVEEALLARVLVTAPVGAPALLQGHGDASLASLAGVRDAIHVLDGGVAANPYTHLLEQTGYQLMQGT